MCALDENHKMLHYAERPESFISDTINAGVYCFSKSVLGAQIRRTPSKNDLYIHFPFVFWWLIGRVRPYYQLTSASPRSYLFSEHETIGALSMERDVLPHLGEKEEAYIYSYTEFWRAIKHAGYAVTQFFATFILLRSSTNYSV
jgi:mannose-1-phosphate guanylyltransferase